MAEMDIDGMDAIMEKLESFEYSESVQEKIEKLSAIVTNMDSEQAALVIEEITKELA